MNAEMKNVKATENQETPKQESPQAAEGAHNPEAGLRRVSWWVPVTAAVVAGLVIFLGIRSRLNAEAAVTHATREAAIPNVSVVHPAADAPAQEIALPGNTVA